MRIILIFFATFLFANEKLLIAKFTNLKPHYYNHQIVKLHLNIISAKDGEIKLFDDYNKTYEIKKDNNSYYSDISFKLQDSFPKFTIKLYDKKIPLENYAIFEENLTLLDELNVTIDSQIKQLYPPKKFCGILADDLEITDQILANYSKNANIVYWTIIAKNGNVEDFRLGLKNEKLYFLDKNDTISQYSYSAIVPLDKRNFKFNYFNLKDENYRNISFNIKLKNDTISTQTNIKPMTKSNIYLIDTLLGIITLLWIVLFIYRRKIIYIILIIISILILLFFNFPKKEIILQEGTQLHVLPFKQSTIFLVLGMDTKVKVLKEKNGYKKIEFNKYIGWIKDE